MANNTKWLGILGFGLALAGTIVNNAVSKKNLNETVEKTVDKKLKALTDGKQAD